MLDWKGKGIKDINGYTRGDQFNHGQCFGPQLISRKEERQKNTRDFLA